MLDVRSTPRWRTQRAAAPLLYFAAVPRSRDRQGCREGFWGVVEQAGLATHAHARPLLVVGGLAGPVFVLSIVLQPLLKPGYNWLRDPGSSLALGPHGWIQTVTFLFTGALALCGALGVWRIGRSTAPRVIAGPIGLVWWSIGLIGAGVFTTDPVAGYPPGVNVRPEYSTYGALHDLFSVPAFIVVALAIGLSFGRWFLRRNVAGWAVYSAVTGLIVLGAFFAAATAFSSPTVLTPFAGALQRLTAVAIWSYFTALCIYLARRAA